MSASAWRIGRGFALAGLAALAAGLVWFPERATAWFWWGVVPLLPVVFLLHPSLWRNVCPLATLGMGPDDGLVNLRGTADGRSTATIGAAAGAAGVVPLLLLVTWRGTGLEQRPVATAILLAATVVVAVLLGRRGVRRSGFCNRYCPLLPVERLYGMRPLLSVQDDRCPSCSGCTPRGCLDLSTRSVVPQLLGPDRRGARWVLTPFGAFAAAFPGFIVAYFQLSGPDTALLLRLGSLAAGAAISWAAVAAAVRATRIPWSVALPSLAALAAGSYYLLSTPRSVAALGGSETMGRALGALMAVAVAAWWIHALRTASGSRGSARVLEGRIPAPQRPRS